MWGGQPPSGADWPVERELGGGAPGFCIALGAGVGRRGCLSRVPASLRRCACTFAQSSGRASQARGSQGPCPRTRCLRGNGQSAVTVVGARRVPAPQGQRWRGRASHTTRAETPAQIDGQRPPRPPARSWLTNMVRDDGDLLDRGLVHEGGGQNLLRGQNHAVARCEASASKPSGSENGAREGRGLHGRPLRAALVACSPRATCRRGRLGPGAASRGGGALARRSLRSRCSPRMPRVVSPFSTALRAWSICPRRPLLSNVVREKL